MPMGVRCPKCGLMQMLQPTCKSCGAALGVLPSLASPARIPVAVPAPPSKDARPSRWGTALLVVGGVSGLVFLGIIGFFAFQYLGSGLDKDTKAYVDEVVPIIAGSWNSKELISRGSPELLRAAPREKIDALFDLFSKRLGPLNEYRGSRGEAKLLFTLQQGKVITASYVAEAAFEKGQATIHIQIIWRNDRWQILSFFVNSEALLRSSSHPAPVINSPVIRS